MTRKFKALGLALVAVFAMSAVVASAASATEFTSASSPVEFHGVQPKAEPHVFTSDGYKTECGIATFSGKATTPTTTVTASAFYDECTAFTLPANITMNGCDYLFHLPTSGDEATVDLVCPAGKEVTIDAGGGACVAHIPPFTGKSSVTMTTKGDHVDAKPNVTGVTAQLTDVSPFFCPFSGNTTVNNATLTGGAMTIIGSSNISVD
ncbi:MAG TPA: hypothetical protein VGV69_05010 [Solirubrobacterales bacterium]|nr:hypothetical protein [Solirubrobacterales bacterium]